MVMGHGSYSHRSPQAAGSKVWLVSFGFIYVVYTTFDVTLNFPEVKSLTKLVVPHVEADSQATAQLISCNISGPQ